MRHADVRPAHAHRLLIAVEVARALVRSIWILGAGPFTTYRGRSLLRTQLLPAVMSIALVAGCAVGQPQTGSASGPPTSTAELVAQDIAFDPQSLRLASGDVVAIRFQNLDPGILHNVTITSSGGEIAFRGETFAGIDSRTYVLAPLATGAYRFVCDAHPTMVGTLTIDP